MKTLTARKLRVLLLIAMVLVAAATIGGFVLLQKNLRGYAEDISKLNADADSGDENIRTLRNIETKLKMEQSTIEKSHSIIANNSTFAEQVVAELNKISAASGVVITGYEYNDAQAPAATPATPAATPAATPQATPAPTTGGLTKKAITVTIQSPVDYSKVMNFIKGVETNNLKMQIASVAMTKAENDQVTAQTFSIEAYVK